MTSNTILPGSMSARKYQKDIIEEEHEESEKVLHEKLLDRDCDDDGDGIMEQGKVIFMEGAFYTVDNNVPIDPVSVNENRLRILSVSDTVKGILGD